jgi:hypothetical protein
MANIDQGMGNRQGQNFSLEHFFLGIGRKYHPFVGSKAKSQNFPVATGVAYPAWKGDAEDIACSVGRCDA